MNLKGTNCDVAKFKYYNIGLLSICLIKREQSKGVQKTEKGFRDETKKENPAELTQLRTCIALPWKYPKSEIKQEK